MVGCLKKDTPPPPPTPRPRVVILELNSPGSGGRCWVFPLHEGSDAGRLCGGAYMCSPAGFCRSNFEDPKEEYRPIFRDGDGVVSAPWESNAKYSWCPEENMAVDSTRRGGGDLGQAAGRPSFRALVLGCIVLGCIDADFCKKIILNIKYSLQLRIF